MAAWLPSGVPDCPTCTVSDHFYDPHVAPDGTGGAFVTWFRGFGTLRVQRLDAAGNPASGWPLAGVQPTGLTGYNWSGRLVPDGAGGVFVGFLVTGCVASCHFDPGAVYLQHLTGSGAPAAGWPANGIPLSTHAAPAAPLAVADGAGGVILAWVADIYPIGHHLYLQRVDTGGNKLWNPTSDGVPACNSDGTQDDPALAADGAGGAFVAWQDRRSAYPDANIFLQHVTGAGTAVVAAGGPVVTEAGVQSDPAIASAGGMVFVAWADPRAGTGLDVRARKYDGALIPQWPDDCAPTCMIDGDQMEPALLADGAGGVFVAWSDARGGIADIYATRLDSDGAAIAPWPSNGLPVTLTTVAEHRPLMAPDGTGGFFMAWSIGRVITTHLNGDGSLASGWQAGGTPACEGNCGQIFGDFFLVTDDAGGAFTTWAETRIFEPPFDATQSFTQRLVIDGVVPVQVSLVAADATADGVRVEWQVREISAVTVERSDGAGWRPRARVMPDAAGRVTYEDTEVTPGAHYGYRLRLGNEITDETWVTLPDRLAFALQGARPDPAVGALEVSFTLPDAAPARLEVLDVAGRRIWSRDVGDLGAGAHVLHPGALLSPGLYTLRLAQRDRVAAVRACVVR
jgi:hypothetical protein